MSNIDKFDKFKRGVSTTEAPVIISEDNYRKLMNGEVVRLGRKPLQHGENIFTGDLANLGHGETVETKGMGRNSSQSYFFKLDDSIPFHNIVKIILTSNLNEVFAIKELFMTLIPDKDVFLDKLGSILD
tara:strand:+ start:59 stop:445 length:387 start_codon:yes stop_codon:yes gene_type:complete